jgi:hypothetical protein
MKWLILLLISIGMAQANEISDKEINNKFLSVVKDVQVEGMLSETAEFNDCRQKNEYQAKKDPSALQTATNCFKEKLENRNPEELKKLADKLELENYGLIKSKNLKEITNYLSKKMTKALTGHDPDETDPQKIKESLLFKNRKFADQKVFIELYNNQLMKNALFEVSRFCFENLRKTSKSNSTDFASHWDGISNGSVPKIDEIDDLGKPSFLKLPDKFDASKSSKVYEEIIKGLTPQKAIDPELYKNFFGYCQQSLPLLCDSFKKSAAVTNAATGNVNQPDVSKGEEMTKGANACITLDRLRSIRTALTHVEKVMKQFEEMDDTSIELLLSEPAKLYQRGSGEGEESLDQLTSYSSADMLANAKSDKDIDAKIDRCKQSGGKECDEYLEISDSLSKAIHNVETEMNLKREIELAKIRKLKEQQKLDDYLIENGFFELAEKLKNSPSGFDIESEVQKIFDARKVAAIEGLKTKVGRRQITEEESKAMGNSAVNQMKAENMITSKEERARLAQVVMFSNIITSQLELTDKNTKKVVGRNVTAWEKEAQGLEQANAFNPSLFQGLKDAADKGGGSLKDASVVGGDIIDQILGKKSNSN